MEIRRSVAHHRYHIIVKTIRLSSTHDVGRRAWKGTTYRNLFDSVQLIISITCIMLSNIVIIVVIVIIRNIIISDSQKRLKEQHSFFGTSKS